MIQPEEKGSKKLSIFLSTFKKAKDPKRSQIIQIVFILGPNTDYLITWNCSSESQSVFLLLPMKNLIPLSFWESERHFKVCVVQRFSQLAKVQKQQVRTCKKRKQLNIHKLGWKFTSSNNNANGEIVAPWDLHIRCIIRLCFTQQHRAITDVIFITNINQSHSFGTKRSIFSDSLYNVKVLFFSFSKYKKESGLFISMPWSKHWQEYLIYRQRYLGY